MENNHYYVISRQSYRKVENAPVPSTIVVAIETDPDVATDTIMALASEDRGIVFQVQDTRVEDFFTVYLEDNEDPTEIRELVQKSLKRFETDSQGERENA